MDGGERSLQRALEINPDHTEVLLQYGGTVLFLSEWPGSSAKPSRTRDPALVHLAVAPDWDSLRADPRFAERLRLMALPFSRAFQYRRRVAEPCGFRTSWQIIHRKFQGLPVGLTGRSIALKESYFE
jgi:hypothetical protein